jgi:hypothetical protein
VERRRLDARTSAFPEAWEGAGIFEERLDRIGHVKNCARCLAVTSPQG